MARHEATVESPQVEAPVRRMRRWRRGIVFAAVIATVIVLVVLAGPNGATYEEYLQLREGMPRQTVDAVIGEGEYWHHQEGDTDVTNWVNKDGTYIRAVFDKSDVLVEVSWESGWDPKWQKR